MSSIPGPIVTFGVDEQALLAAFERASSRLAPRLAQQNRQLAQQFASTIEQSAAKIRSLFSAESAGSRQIANERQRLIGFIDQELAKLSQRNVLTRQEVQSLNRLAQLRSQHAAALEREAALAARIRADEEKRAAALAASVNSARAQAGRIQFLAGRAVPESAGPSVLPGGGIGGGVAGVDRTRGDVTQAATSALLLERLLGIQLPLAVNKFIASTRLIGPALGAAFKATVVLFLIQTLLQLPELFQKIGAAIFDFGGKSQEAYNKAVRFSNSMVDLQGQLKEAEKRFQLAGKDGVDALRIKMQQAQKEWHDQQAIVARTKVGTDEYSLALKRAEIAGVDAKSAAAELNKGLKEQAEDGARKAKEAAEKLAAAHDKLNKFLREQRAFVLEETAPSFTPLAETLVKSQGVIAAENAKLLESVRKGGLTELERINAEWLRSTGQTVALIELEYQKDRENFRKLAKEHLLSAAERAQGELRLEQIKNARFKEEREKQLSELKEGAGRLFDAIVSNARGVGEVLVGIFKAAILTPIRKLFQDIVAAILQPFLDQIKRGLDPLLDKIRKKIEEIFTRRKPGGVIPPINKDRGKGVPDLSPVPIPGGVVTVNAAAANITNLASMSVLDTKLMTVKATSVVITSQQGGGAAGGAFGLLSLFFGGGQGQGGGLFGGGGGGSFFDVIFRGQPGGGQGGGGGGVGAGSAGSPFSRGNLAGTIGSIAAGVLGLKAAAESPSKIQAVGVGALSGYQIGAPFGPIGAAIGAVAGAIFGGIFGGPSKAEIFEQKVQRALKRQTAAAKLLVSDPFAFRFANLDTLDATFGSTFADVQGGGFVASRSAPAPMVVNNHINAIDTASFEETMRRRSGSLNRALSFGGGGRFGSVLQAQLEPA